MKRILLLFISFWLLFSCEEEKIEPEPVKGELSDYREPHRPQFHFSPDSMWMNDPNGMVYLDGEYHLFYQYYPDSTIWGPMHWGHAISEDLLHWEHLPIALYPDSLGLIFSGSAVYDENNTSGLGTEEAPPLVALFTYHNMAGEKAGTMNFQTQGLAYSVDKGRTWTKYADNPVIANPGIKDFRDPKVMWHDSTQQWIMALAAGDRIQFYHSTNLIDWNFASEFGEQYGSHEGVWECPDLFPLALGDSGEERWVLIVSTGDGGPESGPNGGSATQYFVGDFDGEAFSLDPEFVMDSVVWLDYGKDNYAGVTWSNAPDDRRIFIGWMSNWQYAREVPTMRWRSAMTLPRELGLVQTEEGPRLTSRVVEDFEKLRSEPSQEFTFQSLKENIEVTLDGKANQALYELEFQWENAPDSLGIALGSDAGETMSIVYLPDSQSLSLDRTGLALSIFSPLYNVVQQAPLATDSSLSLLLYLDHSSVEILSADGQFAMTSLYFAVEPLSHISIICKGDSLDTVTMTHYPVDRIWE